MSAPRVLVAGVGNIFHGDDAFGVEVARWLTRRPHPFGVRVIDFGIRGLDLTYALLDGYDVVILVNATRRGEAPGTLYVLEVQPPAPEEWGTDDLAVEGHKLDPARVFRLTAMLGSSVRRLLVVGYEPGRTDDWEERATGLSVPVQAAVGEAVLLVESLVRDLFANARAAIPATAAESCRR